MTLRKRKKKQADLPFARGLIEQDERDWSPTVMLVAYGAEGLRLPFDRKIANERAAGLAKKYAGFKATS
jgi:hypothetical protein